MTTHSRILARQIPGTGEPGGLPSMGTHRVGHDLSDLAAAAAATSISNLGNVTKISRILVFLEKSNNMEDGPRSTWQQCLL